MTCSLHRIKFVEGMEKLIEHQFFDSSRLYKEKVNNRATRSLWEGKL